MPRRQHRRQLTIPPSSPPPSFSLSSRVPEAPIPHAAALSNVVHRQQRPANLTGFSDRWLGTASARFDVLLRLIPRTSRTRALVTLLSTFPTSRSLPCLFPINARRPGPSPGAQTGTRARHRAQDRRAVGYARPRAAEGRISVGEGPRRYPGDHLRAARLYPLAHARVGGLLQGVRPEDVSCLLRALSPLFAHPRNPPCFLAPGMERRRPVSSESALCRHGVTAQGTAVCRDGIRPNPVRQGPNVVRRRGESRPDSFLVSSHHHLPSCTSLPRPVHCVCVALFHVFSITSPVMGRPVPPRWPRHRVPRVVSSACNWHIPRSAIALTDRPQYVGVRLDTLVCVVNHTRQASLRINWLKCAVKV